MKSPGESGRVARSVALALAGLIAGASQGLLGVCGPFTDVEADAFCPFVTEIFTLGITTGETSTTYNPLGKVSRLQMAAFLSRTVDAVLKRGSRRAALSQFWTPQNASVLEVTTVGAVATVPASDGTDVWVPSSNSTVSRVRASDGTLLQTWTGATNASAAFAAIGKVFVAGYTSPGSLYRIDPRLPSGVATAVAPDLGAFPNHLAFDGERIWTANNGGGNGSISIVTPGSSLPWTVTTVTVGFSGPSGTVFDGTHVWVTDAAGTLLRLDPAGAVLQTVTVGSLPRVPVFDGANIWVPNFGPDSVSVVRAGSGALLATLTGNGLFQPTHAAFDGERVLVTNGIGDSVSLWKAADLTPIGSVSTGASSSPYGVCSDGLNFWITLRGNQLGRF